MRFLYIFLFALLYAASDKVASEFVQPVISHIDNISDNVITFSAKGIRVGESGIVTRKLKDYEMILASAVVVNVQGEIVKAQLRDFTLLQQRYLPNHGLMPQKGDELVFRLLNNKAFLIAPSFDTFDYVRRKFMSIDFLSPDILLSHLSNESVFDPTVDNIQPMCRQYFVGLVFVLGSKELGVFDCGSFAKIKSYKLSDIGPLPAVGEIHAPFYARLPYSTGGSLFYLFRSKDSKNYYTYYDEFLKSAKSN